MDEQKTGLTNTSPNAKPASPQQQAQFDLLLGRCRQVMGESAEEWLATLKADPVGGAVTLGTTTLRQMATMSEQAGQKVDPTVLINVGVQLVKDVASVANAAGLVPDDQLGQYLQDVMQQSMAEYLDADRAEGLLSPEDLQRGQALAQKGAAAPAESEGAGMLAQMQQSGGAP